MSIQIHSYSTISQTCTRYFSRCEELESKMRWKFSLFPSEFLFTYLSYGVCVCTHIDAFQIRFHHATIEVIGSITENKNATLNMVLNIIYALKRHGQNLERYPLHLKDEKILNMGTETFFSGIMLKILLTVLLTQETI